MTSPREMKDEHNLAQLVGTHLSIEPPSEDVKRFVDNSNNMSNLNR